jgi:hypothetical protein
MLTEKKKNLNPQKQSNKLYKNQKKIYVSYLCVISPNEFFALSLKNI